MSAVEPLLRVIRRPVPGDAGALEAAERECFPDPWPGHLILAEIHARGRFQRVAVTPGGELMAYILGVWQYLDLHILKIATRPPYRRHGLAKELLVLAQDHAAEHGGETVTLEVRSSNAPAIALYRALGYSVRGIRHRYYGDGEDALVMTRAVGERRGAPPGTLR